MRNSIIIDGHEFISVGRASEITKYTNDYVGQLCRGGKIAARMIGRTWFVDRESLTTYKNSMSHEMPQVDQIGSVGAVSNIIAISEDIFEKNYDSSMVPPSTAGESLSIKYISDDRPLLPELNKATVIISSGRASEVEYIPVSRTWVTACVLSLVFVGGAVASMFPIADVSDIGSKSTANISDIWSNVSCAIGSVFLGDDNRWCAESRLAFTRASLDETSTSQKIQVAQTISIASSTPSFSMVGSQIKSNTNQQVKSEAKPVTIIERIVTQPQTIFVNQTDEMILGRVATLEAELAADRLHDRLQTDAIYTSIGRSVSGLSSGSVDLSSISGSAISGSTITTSSFSGTTGVFSSNVSVGGLLSVTGSGTSTISGGLNVTSLNISGILTGAGLAECSGSTDKLAWDGGTFSCGTDAGSSGLGISSLGAQYSTLQTGSSQTFATSSDANIRLTVTSSGNVHTFTPSWSGTLASGRGGTGISSVTANQLLISNSAGTGWTQVATSSLGLPTNSDLNNYLLTSNFGTPFYQLFSATTTDFLTEGSTNKYYSNALVNAYIHASSTIPKIYSANTFTNSNTFSGTATFNGTNIFGGGATFNAGLTTNALTLASINGPLQANNGVVSATTSIGVLYGGTGISTAPSYGNLLVGNALGGYTLTATSSLNIATSNLTGTLGISQGGTNATSQTTNGVNYFNGTSITSGTGFVFDGINVGIGTTTPYSKLSVTGDTAFNGNLLVTGTTTANGFVLNTGKTFYIGTDVLVDSSGNINATVLPLQDTASNLAAIVPASGEIVYETDTKISRVGDGTTGVSNLGALVPWLYSAGKIAYNSGNVGIGTTSPGRTLSVTGSSDLGNNALAGYFTGTTTATSTLAGGLTVRTDKLVVNNFNNNIGIGTTSPTAALSISGTVGIASIINGTGGLIAYGGSGYSPGSSGAGGNGGGFTFGSGNGGNAAGTGGGGSAGSASFILGNGGNSFGFAPIIGGSGGSFSLLAGNGGAGAASGGTGDGGPAGAITFTAGNGNTGGGASSVGGTITLNPGIGGGAAAAGNILLAPTSGNVGIGTTTPWRQLSVNGSSDLGINALAGSFTATSTTATSTFTYDVSVTGALKVSQTGTSATIVGDVTGNARGANALDVQSGRTNVLNVASAATSIAVGYDNRASVSGSLSFGRSNIGSGSNSSAFGYGNTSSNIDAAAFGRSNLASGLAASAFGYSNQAINTGSVAMGTSNVVSGSLSSGFGYSNTVSADGASAFGSSITNSITNSVMIGPSDAAKLTILSTGNIGIGTTSPYAKLSVVGEVVAPYYTATSTTATSTFAGGLSVDETTLNVDFSTNKVGIGMNNPSNVLDITTSNASPDGLKVSNTSGTTRIQMNRAGTEVNGIFSFATAGTERWTFGLANGGVEDLRIQDSSNGLSRFYMKRDSAGGFLGLSTTTPTAKLHINVENSAYVPLKVTGFVSQTADLQQWQNAANASLAVMTSAGSLGIGTTTPWRSLSVTGTVGFDGLTNSDQGNYVCIDTNKQITYSTSACVGLSSQTYKHDISSITSGLSDVLSLRPVSFVYNTDVAPNDRTTHLGFIAEEVNTINPKLVAFDENGKVRSVKYNEFAPVIVKAIQELDAKVSLFNTGSTTSSTPVDTTTIASTTADILASSTPTFIVRVAIAVKEYIQSIGEWAVDKLTAHIVYTDRVEAQVAAISNGLEMTDAVTHQIYCVQISNGDWKKILGTCASQTIVVTLTPTTTSEIQSPAVQQQPTTINSQDNTQGNNTTASSTLPIIEIATTTPQVIDTGTNTSGDTSIQPTASELTPSVTSQPVADISTPITTVDSTINGTSPDTGSATLPTSSDVTQTQSTP